MNVTCNIYEITSYTCIFQYVSNMKYYISQDTLTINNLVCMLFYNYYFVYLNRIDITKTCEQTQIY